MTKDLLSPNLYIDGILSRPYEHKLSADYGTDPTRVIFDETVPDAIEAAGHFIERLAAPHPGANG